jgi:hypothetical protein
MNEINLSPVQHRDSNKHYRVPVHISDGIHTIYVGHNLRRRFDVDTLPELLKHKLSMINASPYGEIVDRGVTNIDVYTIPKDSGFNLIGWRVNQEMYCLVLTTAELDSLKGEHGNTGE